MVWCINQAIIPSSIVALASPSSTTLDDDNDKRLLPTGTAGTTGSRLLSTIHVSSESSMRGTVARSLIVGRQASAADVRIDHKSVSRRHTALYYKHKSSSSSSVMPVLVVRDLGGKHGTHVDDSRLEKNGTVELPLLRGNNREHTIRFGNAPLVCRAIIVPPITSSMVLSPGSNSFTSSDGTNTPLQANASVSALRFEPSGARIVAGHRDGTLRFYDFHGMQPAVSTSASSGKKITTYPPFRIVDSDNDPLNSTGRHVLTALPPRDPSGSSAVPPPNPRYWIGMVGRRCSTSSRAISTSPTRPRPRDTRQA